MRRFPRVLGSLALLGSLGCANAPPPAATWSVDGGFIRDASGRAVILRGVQMTGDQKSAPYISTMTFDDYRRLRDDWGLNSLRFLMVWAAIEPQKGQYDAHYLDEVATRVGWAEQLGLSVVLDMHEDIYGEGFGFDGAPKWACDAARYAAFKPVTPWALDAIDPNVEACVDALYDDPETVAHFTEAWRRVAARLKDSPAVVGFDVLNEPGWGSAEPAYFERDTLESFYEGVVAAVRAEAPHWLAFLEPASSRNIGIPTSLTPFPFANVVYAPHSYDNNAETTGAFPPEDVGWVESNAATLEKEAESLHAALWIGEYGGQWNDPNIGLYLGAQYEGIGAVAAGSSLWAAGRGGGYDLLDENGVERPGIANALALPYPPRTAGTPVSYAFDETTSTFTFVYEPDAKITAATELSIPARVYPSGYAVDCGGCTWKATTTGLDVTKPGAGARVTVTLKPSGS